jgi:tetratricopeptide (TPR) repeat protein
MARVYVSSTVVDLRAEREAVMSWLVAAGHQPVHSYRPDSDTVRDSCLDDIDGCDLYVLILGHRYGFTPEDGNPEQLSITHLEFRRAGQSRIPRVVLLRTSVPDVKLSDLLDADKAARVRAFQDEVRRQVRAAEFSTAEGLIHGLSTGVQGELDKLARTGRAGRPEIARDDPRVLEVMATLVGEMDRKNREIDEYRAANVVLQGRVRELEDQLQTAVARTLTAAAQPDAGEAAIAAADALKAGDSRPAEALLGKQERLEAGRIGSPEADDAEQRRQAAALAREQGALAISHDTRAALSAYQRAAQYEPDDTWTHFFIGDLHLRLGDLGTALESFRRGAGRAEARARADSTDLDAQRDLSVSETRSGTCWWRRGTGRGRWRRIGAGWRSARRWRRGIRRTPSGRATCR